jgi:hypothetical protein
MNRPGIHVHFRIRSDKAEGNFLMLGLVDLMLGLVDLMPTEDFFFKKNRNRATTPAFLEARQCRNVGAGARPARAMEL